MEIKKIISRIFFVLLFAIHWYYFTYSLMENNYKNAITMSLAYLTTFLLLFLLLKTYKWSKFSKEKKR